MWHSYHHARQASVTLLCNWVGDLSVESLGGPERFVTYFISTVAHEQIEADANKPGKPVSKTLPSLLAILSKFLQAEAAKNPEISASLTEEECHQHWPIASLILRACGDVGQVAAGKQKLDGKLATTVTRLGIPF